MTLKETTKAIYEYLGKELEVDCFSLHNGQLLIVEHSGELKRYKGAYLVRNEYWCVCSVPKAFLQMVQQRISMKPIDIVFERDFLQNLFGSYVDIIIGPTFLGYANKTDFYPVFTHQVSLIDEMQHDYLYELKEECSELEWERSDIELNRQPIMGCFVQNKLVAAGSWRDKGGVLSIGILTHPQYRKQGFGKAIVSALTQYGLQCGGIMQYQTLESNTSSVSIASSLGYKRLLQSISVRLRNFV
ncbi:GNAT family N-acetyltransferase [Bacillus rhizoplanae]|uniref:GNAT family N-acetyltransferase n=1 Tax=Bacillus rhizoplanae TaxID=2880966 RepID=UPI003D2387DD